MVYSIDSILTTLKKIIIEQVLLEALKRRVWKVTQGEGRIYHFLLSFVTDVEDGSYYPSYFLKGNSDYQTPPGFKGEVKVTGIK